MTTGFKDHFSMGSQIYRSYRPTYPKGWFQWLSEQCPEKEMAADIATGNGQAATGLAEFFDSVIAFDASENQLKEAQENPKVTYRVGRAEEIALPDHSADLVTVAQAVHWFDLERFYNEVRRLTKPKGVLALWSYGLAKIDPQVDAVIAHYYSNVVGPFWPEERRWIEEGYHTLSFPFKEIKVPDFFMRADWDLKNLTGYLNTWSATTRAREAWKTEPLDKVKKELEAAWGNQTRKVLWRMDTRVGRVG